MQSFSLNQLILAAAMVMVAGAAQAGDGIHAPWPTDWNNWSDSALWVSVSNINNAADTNTGNLYGSVDHAYKIGKYEVTAGQYTEFLNAKAKTDTYGLYDYGMAEPAFIGCNIQRTGSEGHYSYSVASDWANRPVDFVSFWDAARFTNWLSNSQGDGDTETGAYTLNGYMGLDGRTITRNPGAKYFLPSENEWYKAAYYDPNKPGGAGYWNYPTRTTIPATPGQDTSETTNAGNNANYSNYSNGSPYYRTHVGEFNLSVGPYGTFDQGGNVMEWNETILWNSDRGVRGGSFLYDSDYLRASFRYYDNPYGAHTDLGFRVASVPEPSSLLMAATIALAGLMYWRRSRKPA